MTLPEGRLRQSRVVEDPGAALSAALDRKLTGYAVLEPQDTLLLDADDAGVIRFRSGVAVAAYHGGTDRGGPPALADLAVPGPYSVELYAVDGRADRESGRRIPPGMAAERLAGDPALADRVRAAASERGVAEPAGDGAEDPAATAPGADGSDPARADESADGDPDRTAPEADPADAVRAFLDDDEKIAALKSQAREQARDRAAEWGIEDQLTGAE